jgi:thiol-disulfide isomerase/thioredoxin
MTKHKFVVYCIVLNCAVFLLGPFELNVRFIGTAIILFIGGLFLLNNAPFVNKNLTIFYIFGVNILLLLSLIIYSLSISQITWKAICLLFATIIASSAVILANNKQPKTVLKVSLMLLTVILFANFFVIPNLDAEIGKKQNIMVNKNFPKLNFYNNDTLVDLNKLKGKIIVLDFWNSNCANCFQAFPKFEEAKNHYKNNPDILFYAVNVLDSNNNRDKSINDLEQLYTFNNLIADDEVAEKLNFNSVPNYFIIDKNQKIRYNFSAINFEENIIYNNFYTIIDELQNEK